VSADPQRVDVLVVGAGFGGLYAVHKLRNELGLNVVAVDRASDVGGTWYWNKYPGARSDTEATAYCYSFDAELFATWNWTERFPKRDEILAYLQHVAEKFDLRRSYHFNTSVLSAEYDEAAGAWLVTTDRGSWMATFLVEGVGNLSATNLPSLPGVEHFQGVVCHTSRWPEDLDLKGKRVGVVGTGSTGVQLIPEAAKIAAHVTVFQRTPQYSVPAAHRRLEAADLQRVRTDPDAYWASVRSSISAFGIKESDVPTFSVGEEQRKAVYEDLWRSGGGFQFMLSGFSDVISDRRANGVATDFIKEKIRQIVDDPATAAALTPSDLYAKRPLCDDGYYETFNRPNVDLIDLRADPIVTMTKSGVQTSRHEIPLDVLVMATGFDAATGNYLRIKQVGRQGVSLTEHWAGRPLAWAGIMTAGFPNLFMLYGPLGPFTNQPPVLEATVDWIASTIEHLRGEGMATIELTEDLESDFVRRCDEIAAGTLFPETDSWINGANIPGKPRAVMAFMGGMAAWLDELSSRAATGYPGFHLA
jgi:cation diffusion facilitator CzcD-associated flavoprotein CzcO